MSANQARRDLKEKLMFERQLIRKLNGLNKRIAKAVAKEYTKNGNILNAQIFRPEIEELLLKHYAKVQKEFSNRITEDMPKDIEVTSDEREIIDSALNIFFVSLAGEQAHLITRTNQENINASFVEAQNQDEEAQLAKAFTPIEIAVIAATNLIRKLTGRTSTIAAYETQVAAETSKSTEGQVLSGQDPSVLAGTTRESGVKKEWVTMGDERVRLAHMVADGQVRDVNETFDVGGEQLMFPGDSSHGASAGNVINCRCAAVFDKNTVYAERRESNELLESIQESL